MSPLNKRIGFMGAGQMAEALARGLIDKGVVQASQICCSDPTAARKELFRSLGTQPYDSNLEVTATAATATVSTASTVSQLAGIAILSSLLVTHVGVPLAHLWSACTPRPSNMPMLQAVYSQRGMCQTFVNCLLQVAKHSDVLFVSVKPQYVHQVLTDARPGMTDDTLIISIAAGITGVCSDRQQHPATVTA